MKDLSPEARQLLEVARDGDSPSTGDRARVRRALAATLATGGVSTSASAAAATKTALGGAAKGGVGLWLALGAATGVVTSAIAFVAAPAWKAHEIRSAGQAATRTAAPAAKDAPSTPSVAAPGTVTTAQPQAARGEPTPEAATQVAERRPAPEATTPVAAQAPSTATPIAAQGSPHKNKRAPEGSSTDTTSRGARAEGASEPGSAGSAVPPAAAPASAAVPSSLGAETALLENARAALGRGDAAGALSVLDEHERDFPRGVLVEERLATRVFALCSLGRRTEAQGVAERLLRHSPSSPLRARVLQSCAGSR
jgi:hypothetical protein